MHAHSIGQAGPVSKERLPIDCISGGAVFREAFCAKGTGQETKYPLKLNESAESPMFRLQRALGFFNSTPRSPQKPENEEQDREQQEDDSCGRIAHLPTSNALVFERRQEAECTEWDREQHERREYEKDDS